MFAEMRIIYAIILIFTSSLSFGQEYISFFSGTNWPNGTTSATDIRSDADNRQFTSYSGCVYADVTMGGGNWRTGGYPRYTNAGATFGFGMELSVDWSNCNSSNTMTITFKNANGGSPTAYPVSFSILGLNSHACGSATSANRFIDRVSIQGFAADLTTSVTPNITKICSDASLIGNSVTGTASCGTSNTNNTADVSFASVARIVITFSSDIGHPPTLNCGTNPSPLLSTDNPRQQEIYISAFKLIDPGSSAPIGISGNTAICQGSSTNLTAVGGNSSTRWYTGSCNGTQIGTGSSISVSPASTTTYYVANAGLCGITSCTSATVVVTAAPSAGLLSGTQTICVNGTTTFNSTVSGGSWSSSNPSVATINTSTGVITGVSSGSSTITYTVAGSGACPSATVTRTVNVIAPASAGTLSGNQGVCINAVTTISSNGTAGGTWTSSNTAVATVNTSGVVTGLSAGTAAINYSVNSPAPCSGSDTETITVTVVAPPNAGTISGTSALCLPGTTTLSTDGNTGGTWSSSNTAVATVNPSGVVTAVSAGTATITYTVNATSPCTTNSSSTFNITVTTGANAGTLSGTTSVCQGSTTTISSNGTAGGTWTSSNTAVATVNTSGVVTGLSAGTAAINYSVNSPAPCSGSDTETIIVTVNPLPNLSTENSVQVCDGELLTLSASGAVNYTWSNGAQNNSSFVPVVGTQTYTVIGENEFGCIALDSIIITVHPLPTIFGGNDQVLCEGEQILLVASGGLTYTWSNGVENGIPFQQNSGTTVYTVSGVDSNGCSNTSSLVVTVNPIPDASFQVSSATGQVPFEVQLMTDVQPGASYTWNLGDGNQFSGVTSLSHVYEDIGTFVINLYVELNGCLNSISQVVNVQSTDISFEVPNVFSPNTDGSNDFFTITNSEGLDQLESFEIVILNRWGNVIVTFNDALFQWDGKSSDGLNATDGVYFYLIKAQTKSKKEIAVHGFFHLIR